MTASLIRVAIRVSLDEREHAIAALLELAPQGFDEIEREDGIEFGVYTDADGEARLRAVFDDVESAPVEPGWEDAWRAFHLPVEVGGLWIGPSWESAPAGSSVVVIDPGRAFGTGAHPTTRLCIELLASVPRGSLLDVGCGSGVLAIAGARLGFEPVHAIDDDPVAVETTRANASVNDVLLDVRLVDATTDALPRADVALANVLLRPVETVLARLDAGVAVVSGYLDGEVPAHDGWTRVATRTLDGWAADRFDR